MGGPREGERRVRAVEPSPVWAPVMLVELAFVPDISGMPSFGPESDDDDDAKDDAEDDAESWDGEREDDVDEQE